jgi:hypothetical protein
MAILTCSEIWAGRDADLDVGKRGSTIRASRIWRITTNSRYDNGVTLIAAMGSTLPEVGDEFATGGSGFAVTCWLRGISAHNESFSPYVWIVTAKYSSEYEPNVDPTQEPAKIAFKTQQYQAKCTQDRNGNAPLNAAGDLLDVSKNDSLVQFTLRKNVTTVPAAVQTYRNAINASSITISDGQGVSLAIAAKFCLVMSIDIGEWQRGANGDTYYCFTWAGAISNNATSDGWDENYLNAGLYQIAGGVRVPCALQGQPVHRPVSLSTIGAMIINPTTASMNYILVEKYFLRDFSSLPTS